MKRKRKSPKPDYLYCKRHEEKLPVKICAIRHINAENGHYKKCKGCKQFDPDIVPKKSELGAKYFPLDKKPKFRRKKT